MLPPGDVLLVNALALSNNGIGRMELYVDERLTDGVNSSLPSQQTAMQATLSAADLNTGTHSFYIRAYDVTGQKADTQPATIEVREGAPRVARGKGTAVPTRTPFPPTPTPTPQLVLPGPPTIELALANAPVVLPGAAQIRILARGSSELDHVELWGRAPGETSAQLLLEENVKGATEKTLTFDWQAPRAGVVEMFARVTDNLKQVGLSTPLHFNIQAPLVPTPPPAVFDFSQAWAAESPAARFQINFVQIGQRAPRHDGGAVADGKIVNGKIVSGAVNDKTVLFGVEPHKRRCREQFTFAHVRV